MNESYILNVNIDSKNLYSNLNSNQNYNPKLEINSNIKIQPSNKHQIRLRKYLQPQPVRVLNQNISKPTFSYQRKTLNILNNSLQIPQTSNVIRSSKRIRICSILFKNQRYKTMFNKLPPVKEEDEKEEDTSTIIINANISITNDNSPVYHSYYASLVDKDEINYNKYLYSENSIKNEIKNESATVINTVKDQAMLNPITQNKESNLENLYVSKPTQNALNLKINYPEPESKSNVLPENSKQNLKSDLKTNENLNLIKTNSKVENNNYYSITMQIPDAPKLPQSKPASPVVPIIVEEKLNNSKPDEKLLSTQTTVNFIYFYK